MLRSLVLVLLLTNVVFYTWAQGWLDPWVGLSPQSQHEPGRLSQQRNRDALIVLPPPIPASLSSSLSSSLSRPISAINTAALSCLEAGPFTVAEYSEIEATLAPLLNARIWSARGLVVEGEWMIYMGPYPDAETLATKQAELRRLNMADITVVRNPAALANGLSLGLFKHLDEAHTGLSEVKQKGVRSARVVTLRRPSESQMMRIEEADEPTVMALANAKLPQGKAFIPCES